MERVAYYKETDEFKYTFSRDVLAFNSKHDLYEFDEDDVGVVICPDIEGVVKAKIENTLYDIIYLKCKGHKFRYEHGDLIIASHVKKSRTEKSVEHEAISNDKYDINPSTYFRYNLPTQFRNMEFTSIVAKIDGPYSKKNQDGVLVECEPWYKEEVFYVGTTYDCIKHYILESIEEFITNTIVLPLCIKWPFILDEVDSLQKEQIFSELYNFLSESISVAIDIQESYEDYGDDGWREIADDEERSMDEETDGFWRWNID